MMSEQEYDDNGCHISCPVRIMGEQSGERKSGGKVSTNTVQKTGVYGGRTIRTTYGHDDSGTAARYFEQFYPDEEYDEHGCHISCPVRIMGEQSGERKSGGKAGKRYTWYEDHGAAVPFARREGELSGTCISDTGTAARYFEQFYPDEPEHLETTMIEQPHPNMPLDRVIHGDALTELRKMADQSVDACITDPPYGLSKEPDIREVLTYWLAGDTYEHKSNGFMGKSWDSFVPGPQYWQEVYRVLKPGAHLLAFGGTRTYDLLVIAIRLAGFECRDMLLWLHGQGFPKSLNLGNGQGTALKPAHEPIILARKSLSEPTIAANVLKWNGCGGLNIDASRVACTDKTKFPVGQSKATKSAYAQDEYSKSWKSTEDTHPSGRFPSNLLLSHSLWCQRRSVKRVRGNKGFQGWEGQHTINDYGKYEHRSATNPSDPDGAEQVEDWLCADDCPIKQMDAQGPHSKSAKAGFHGRKEGIHVYGGNALQHSKTILQGSMEYGDEGGPSRYFQNFPPEEDSMVEEWLCAEDCPIAEMDRQSGVSKASARISDKNGNDQGQVFSLNRQNVRIGGYQDEGTAARYFQNFPPDAPDFVPFLYTSKSSRRERNAGLEGLPEHTTLIGAERHKMNPTTGKPVVDLPRQNTHPTVKSLALMRWLCRLVGVPGGVILDPFLGSGSTAVAAIQEGFHFIGVEQDLSYCQISEARIRHAMQEAGRVEETAGEYEYHESCPVYQMDKQSGIRKSGGGVKVKAGSVIGNGNTHGHFVSSFESPRVEPSEGGASRYFTQFPPDSLFAEEVSDE